MLVRICNVKEKYKFEILESLKLIQQQFESGWCFLTKEQLEQALKKNLSLNKFSEIVKELSRLKIIYSIRKVSPHQINCHWIRLIKLFDFEFRENDKIIFSKTSEYDRLFNDTYLRNYNEFLLFFEKEIYKITSEEKRGLCCGVVPYQQELREYLDDEAVPMVWESIKRIPYNCNEYFYFVSKTSEINRICFAALLKQQKLRKEQGLNTYFKIWYPCEELMTAYNSEINFFSFVNEICISDISEKKESDLLKYCHKVIFVDNGKLEQEITNIMNVVYHKKIPYKKVELLSLDALKKMTNEMFYKK